MDHTGTPVDEAWEHVISGGGVGGKGSFDHQPGQSARVVPGHLKSYPGGLDVDDNFGGKKPDGLAPRQGSLQSLMPVGDFVRKVEDRKGWVGDDDGRGSIGEDGKRWIGEGGGSRGLDPTVGSVEAVWRPDVAFKKLFRLDRS